MRNNVHTYCILLIGTETIVHTTRKCFRSGCLKAAGPDVVQLMAAATNRSLRPRGSLNTRINIINYQKMSAVLAKKIFRPLHGALCFSIPQRL
jgi:hypothetical protein